MVNIYVAAPYVDAPYVRMFHKTLEFYGHKWTSRWAEVSPGGPEVLTLEAAREAIKQNDEDVERADCLLVMARQNAGGEMFAEARYALTIGKPVYWLGRAILSTYRPGVTIVKEIDHFLNLVGPKAP